MLCQKTKPVPFLSYMLRLQVVDESWKMGRGNGKCNSFGKGNYVKFEDSDDFEEDKHGNWCNIE